MTSAEKKQARKLSNILAAQRRAEAHKLKMAERDAAAKLASETNLEVLRQRDAERQEGLRRQQFVAEALAGPSAIHLERWLKNRQATYDRVFRFFDERPNLVRTAQPARLAA